MRGIERLKAIERSTEPLAQALPALPQAETVLIRLLRVGAFGLDDYFSQVFCHWELGEKLYHTLCVLVATPQGRAYPSELSELIGTSRANMTKVLAALERDRYIRREVGLNDGRRSMVHITRRGRDIVNQITPDMVEPVKTAFAKLTPPERAALDQLLRKLIVSLDEAKGGAGAIS